MKTRIIFILALAFNFGLVTAQSTTEQHNKPTMAMLGSFHFAGSSDLIALKVDDLKSDKRQNEILNLIEALAKFKPTKVILEYPLEPN